MHPFTGSDWLVGPFSSMLLYTTLTEGQAEPQCIDNYHITSPHRPARFQRLTPQRHISFCFQAEYKSTPFQSSPYIPQGVSIIRILLVLTISPRFQNRHGTSLHLPTTIEPLWRRYQDTLLLQSMNENRPSVLFDKG